jgi:hypothetical protein
MVGNDWFGRMENSDDAIQREPFVPLDVQQRGEGPSQRRYLPSRRP